MSEGQARRQFEELLWRMSGALPEIYFEIIEDDESPEGFYIALLSTGPDYTPEIETMLPEGWVFSGWRNPDQRNNLAVVRRRRNGVKNENDQ